MRIASLSDLNLHDSELIDFVIRNDETSVVIVHLDYIEDYETLRTSKKSLVFRGCVKVIVDANLVVSPDSLRTGYELESSEILDDIKNKFSRVGIPIPNYLKHFYLETNSNASVLNVIAESVDLEEP
jgi:hypothetical protein